jgi:uncharacterized membrane protein
MNETTLIAVAAVVASLTVALLRIGVSSELRAAIRTTVVVILGSVMAYEHNRNIVWSDLSWREQGMVVICALAVLSGWVFHFRAIGVPPASSAVVTDRVNIVFACLFGFLFIAQNPSERSVLIVIMLVVASLVLACKPK